MKRPFCVPLRARMIAIIMAILVATQIAGREDRGQSGTTHDAVAPVADEPGNAALFSIRAGRFSLSLGGRGLAILF